MSLTARRLRRSGSTRRGNIMAEPVPEDDILGAENFSGDVDKNIFYKYLAR